MRVWVAAAMLLTALAGCAGDQAESDGADTGDGTATGDALANQTQEQGDPFSNSTAEDPFGNATEDNATANVTEPVAAGPPAPATGSCTVSFLGVNVYDGGNSGFATYGAELCTTGPITPSSGSFTAAVVTLDWSSTTPPVDFGFDVIDVDGNVLASVEGIGESPVNVPVTLDMAGDVDIGGQCRLTGAFADFEGTVTVNLV